MIGQWSEPILHKGFGRATTVLDKSLYRDYYSSMSSLQAVQVKTTLPGELYLHLKSRAERFGLNLASYVRHLVITDVKDIDVPVFRMSDKTEKRGLRALKEYREGKTTKIDDINKYFDNL